MFLKFDTATHDSHRKARSILGKAPVPLVTKSSPMYQVIVMLGWNSLFHPFIMQYTASIRDDNGGTGRNHYAARRSLRNINTESGIHNSNT